MSTKGLARFVPALAKQESTRPRPSTVRGERVLDLGLVTDVATQGDNRPAVTAQLLCGGEVLLLVRSPDGDRRAAAARPSA